MRTQAKLAGCVVAVAFATLGTGEVRAEVLSRFRANGGSAVASWCTANGCAGININVNDVTNEAQVFVSSADRAAGSFVAAFATIPADLLRGNTEARLTIEIDLSTVPDLVCFGTPGACPLANGLVSLEFVANGFSSQSSSGTVRNTYGQLATTQTGTSEIKSATASGTLLGIAVPEGANAGLGRNIQSSVVIERGP
jgi:hypothetical protein